MSGILVGEVIAAAARLKNAGLTERGFHALVAIAEKCMTDSRQGSVPWSHIRAGLFGVSESTAKRAVADCKSVGALKVVKRGFNNQAGRVCAPIYQIEPLGEQVTQVTRSPATQRVTQVTHSPIERTGQNRERTGQIRGRTGHPGDLLNVSINGSISGGRGAQDTHAPPPPNPAGIEPPPRFCHKHMPAGTNEPCPDCGRHRQARHDWDAGEKRRKDVEAHARRVAIDGCHNCDANGLHETDDGMSRCNHDTMTASTARGLP